MSAELRALVEDLIKNPDKLNEMKAEDVAEVYRKVHPCGTVSKAKTSWANISITNYREEYLKKLLMTSLVGYIYRVADEYDDEGQSLEFLKDPAYGLNLSEEQFEKIKAAESKKYSTHLKRFLDRNFNFNPDRHVSSTYRENTKDPERHHKFDAFRTAMSTSKSADAVSVEMGKDPKSTLEFLNDNLLKTYQMASVSSKLVNKLAQALSDPSIDSESQIGLLLKYQVKFADIANSLKPFAEPIAAKNTVTVYKADLPVDVFYHWNRYITNHYEQLREACTVLHAEKPDIEFAIQFYEAFDELKKAEEHQRKNESSVVSSIYTLESGGWTMMGPFQENRERVNFYNKNTEVIKRLFEQMESDHKLGKDLMEKRVKVQKQKNIVEAGPDDPGLKNYTSALTTIESLGAKKVLSEEEKKKLAEANRVKEMAEVPKDAIQVDMFRTDEDGKLVRDKFYTEAEAPKFMEENIENLKQQLQAGGKPAAERVIKGRNGVEVPISELRARVKSESHAEDNIQ